MDKITLFKELFKGRQDIYALEFKTKKGKKGYSPACANRFKRDYCNHRCFECPSPKHPPLTDGMLKRHLAGEKVVGVYPLFPDETSCFIAADFDNHTGGHDPLKDVKEFYEVCKVNEIDCYIERSRSGKGFHGWIFFEDKIPAWKSRMVMFALLQEAQAVSEETELKSFDRLFPNQDKLSGKKFGNLIALPLQGQAVKEENTTFLDMGNSCKPYVDQWSFLSTVKKVSESKLDDLIKEWDLKKEEHKPIIPIISTETEQEGLEKVLECDFIQYCKENAKMLREPLWYALITNLLRFKDGVKTIHEYSTNYPTYSSDETNRKIEHGLKDSKPHTCDYIRRNGFNCEKDCNVKSPAGLVHKTSSSHFGALYILDNGGFSKVEYDTKGEEKITPLCNFNLDLHSDTLIDDGLEQERWFKGVISIDKKTKAFFIRGREFANKNKLQEAILEQGGVDCQFNSRFIDDIRLASQQLSTTKEEKVFKQFGWMDDENYISPATIINKDGISPHGDLKVDLSTAENAKWLDITTIDDEAHKKVIKHVVDDLLSLNDPSITYPTIAHAFASPLIYFLEDDSKYILWLRGLTGSGKSFIARRAQNFFGDFSKSGAFVSWTSTMNFIQTVGFYFKDAVFLVDDYKSGHIQDRKELIQKIQSYADNSGRGRLNPDSTTKQTRPIRGFMISTGEDIPVNEASTLARLIIIDFSGDKKDLERGHRCLELQKFYSGVMGRYIHWLLRTGRTRDIKEMERNYQRHFYHDIAGKQNDSRIAHNLAVNMVGFEFFCDFISDAEGSVVDLSKTKEMVAEHKQILKEIRDKSIMLVKEEQASSIFLRVLSELLNSGRVAIEGEIPTEDPLRNVVGFRKGDDVCIAPAVAYQEVQRVLRDSGSPLNFSITEVGRQLVADGIITEHEPNRPTKVIRRGDGTVRCFVIPAKYI